MHEIDLESLLKMNFRPLNGDFLLACGLLLLLLGYAMLMAIDYELVYNGIRGDFGHLELVEVDGICLA